MNRLLKIGYATLICLALSSCASNAKTDDVKKIEAKQALAEKMSDITETKTVTVSVSDKTEKICKRVQQTGTRFKTKICRTKDEWDFIADRSRHTASEAQRNGARQANPTGG